MRKRMPTGKMFLIIWLMIMGVGIAALSPIRDAVAQGSTPNKIVAENQHPGTTRWDSKELEQEKLNNNHGEENVATSNRETSSNTWTDRQIKGYANLTSVNRGSAINFYVSTYTSSYSMEIYRYGWYGGAGARLIMSIPTQPGHDYGIPAPDPTTGLIEANWPVAYTLNVGSDWVSGVYQAKLIAADGSVGYILFIVRDDSSTSDILYVVSISTYQAYNNWGGKSLYDFNSTNGRAYKVSYDRPYNLNAGAGPFYDGDYMMIRWMEAQGYDISYATSIDLEENPNLLANHKVYLSNWHDEYWSKNMRDHITAARDAGKHLAFFDSNNIYWQIRFEPSSSGVPDRIQTCYKDATKDPMSSITPSLTTVRWRDNPVNQPENALLGVMYENDYDYSISYPLVVENSSSWVYAGTGLQDGDSINKVIGHEYDKVFDNGLTPANLTVLSNSPIPIYNSYSNASIYTAPSGAIVFDASTNRWSWLLDDSGWDPNPIDPRIEQITANILNKLTGRPLPPTSTPAPTHTSAPTATFAPPTPTSSGGTTLKVQYQTEETNPTSDQIIPDFKIVNMTGNSVPLSQLTLRYWFTRDTPQTVVYSCVYAPMGCSNVLGKFVYLSNPLPGADTYLELSFASGSIAAFGNTNEIQTYNHKSDWSNFNENDDYSFDMSKTTYTDSPKVTLYQNGVLIWGVEPGNGPITTSTATSTPGTTTTPAPTRTPVSATATPNPSAAFKIQYMTSTTGGTVSEIDPDFRIVNNSGASVPLYQFKIRYWFTRDTPRTVLFSCYYATGGCSNAYGSFTYLTTPQTNADTYLEIGFNGSAGNIGAGGTSDIDVGFHKNDWSAFSQANDYSFNSSMTSLTDAPTITLYRNGALVWGTEPGTSSSAKPIATSTFVPPGQ